MVENKITKHKYFYPIVVIVMTVVITMALIFLVIVPFFNKAKSLTSEVSLKKQELERLEDKKAKLEELKSREEELKLQAEKVQNALPTDKDVGRLFIQLDSLVKGSGGTVTSITEGEAAATTTNVVEEEGLNISKISYSLPAKFNDYFKFKDFISKSESALRLVTIDGVNVTADEEGKVDSNVTINAYVRKEQ